jgi:PAS domain S-box-containing protein
MTAQLKKYTLILLTVWLGAGTLSLAWNIYDDRQERKNLAMQAAHTFLAQIQNTRIWITTHKGVYVPITEAHQPSPHLTSDPQRDPIINEQVQLIKISPAAMIRELSLIAARNKGATFHITSLDPSRPENSPYAWETPWLQKFQTHPQEISAIVTIKDKTLFRFMAPLLVKKECLGCHSEKKYSIGKVRGGISITLPMEKNGLSWPLLLSHLGPMVAGCMLILFFSTKLNANETKLLSTNQSLNREIHDRKKIQDKLQASRDQLEERVAERTLELSEANLQLNRKIHERAHIEKALTMIYDEFYQLFNSAPDGILVVDSHFDIMRANRAFAKLCSQPLNKIIGRKCFEMFSGPACKTSACPLHSIFKGQKRVEIECEKIVLTDRENIQCIVTSTPFRETDGSLIGAIMVITDISNRRQTELALENSTERLKKSNQALEDFAHIISHDLQEPLMLIQAFSQRLKIKADKELNQQCSHYIEQINTAAERMHDLIKGLLLYSRVGNKTEPFIPIDLTVIIDEVLDTLALQIEKSNSTIIKDKLPIIPGDPLQIRQLFQNIIGNSLKYRRKDIPHTIHIRNQSSQQNDDDHSVVQISIKDNGIGFNPEDGQHIFDVFERLPTEKKIAGTGIGLAICKKVVSRHGGDIKATGRPNQGANFTIRLPLKKGTHPLFSA